MAALVVSCGNSDEFAGDINELHSIYQDAVISDRIYQKAKNEEWGEVSNLLELRIKKLNCRRNWQKECIVPFLHLSGSKAKEGKTSEARLLLNDLEAKLLCGTAEEDSLCELVRRRQSELAGD